MGGRLNIAVLCKCMTAALQVQASSRFPPLFWPPGPENEMLLRQNLTGEKTTLLAKDNFSFFFFYVASQYLICSSKEYIACIIYVIKFHIKITIQTNYIYIMIKKGNN